MANDLRAVIPFFPIDLISSNQASHKYHLSMVEKHFYTPRDCSKKNNNNNKTRMKDFTPLSQDH